MERETETCGHMSKLTRKDLDELLAQGCISPPQHQNLMWMLKIEPRKDEVRPLTFIDYLHIGGLVLIAVAIAYYIGLPT